MRTPSSPAEGSCPPPPAEPAEIDRALARAVLARVLEQGLERPSATTRDSLASELTRVAVAEAARTLEGGSGRGPGRLQGAVAELGAARVPELAELTAAHDRLFGHSLRGLVCPYELEYGRRDLLLQAQELADLAGFYHAFGLQVASSAHERADCVTCELAFLDFLCRKEAYALDASDAAMAETTRAARRRFLAEHLGRFGRTFARALREAAELELHRRLAGSLEAFLECLCLELAVPLGPPMLELRATEEAVPMACGEGCDAPVSGEGPELVPLGGLLSTRSAGRGD